MHTADNKWLPIIVDVVTEEAGGLAGWISEAVNPGPAGWLQAGDTHNSITQIVGVQQHGSNPVACTCCQLFASKRYILSSLLVCRAASSMGSPSQRGAPETPSSAGVAPPQALNGSSGGGSSSSIIGDFIGAPLTPQERQVPS